MKRKEQTRRGATQAVIGVLGIGLAFGISAVPQLQAADTAWGRDQTRISSLYRMQHALDSYFEDMGTLPSHTRDPKLGGWETSLDGEFLMDLVRAGYLTSIPADPLGGDAYHFRYCVYGPATWDENEQPFYVLAATKLELPNEHANQVGHFELGERCWNDEFDFVLSGP